MTEKPTIDQALAAVMTDVSHVAKRDVNQHQRFHFRGVDAVVNAVGPALRKYGVSFRPIEVDVSYEVVQTSTGKPSTACRVRVSYAFRGPAGDEIGVQVAGEAWDAGDKACPKAMSVAYRTALLQGLCLPTDEPDPDHSTYERAPQIDMNLQKKRVWAHARGDDDVAKKAWIAAAFEARGTDLTSPEDMKALADELEAS